jgi:hypothetical protein
MGPMKHVSEGGSTPWSTHWMLNQSFIPAESPLTSTSAMMAAASLNYAEWTTEKEHREALEKPGQGPKWSQVQSFPGVLSAGFKRYQLVRSLLNAES